MKEKPIFIHEHGHQKKSIFIHFYVSVFSYNNKVKENNFSFTQHITLCAHSSTLIEGFNEYQLTNILTSSLAINKLSPCMRKHSLILKDLRDKSFCFNTNTISDRDKILPIQ